MKLTKTVRSPKDRIFVALFSFEIDPHKVLGVTAQASLQEIRDAYKQKAKRYHPDAGGEEWSFRILVQAYEMLSSARVARATRRTRCAAEPVTRRVPGPSEVPSRSTPEFTTPALTPVSYGRRRAPLRPLSLGRRRVSLAHPARPDEDRFLSCNLNLSWPDQGAVRAAETLKRAGSDLGDAA